MKRFEFSLETLLVLRQAELEKQGQQLAIVVTAYNREKEKLRVNRENSANTWKNLSSQPRRCHSDYLYMQRLEKQSHELDSSLHEARLAMDEEQKRYAEMRKKILVLEKLRDKQYSQYKQKLEKVQDEEAAEMSRARKLAKPLGRVAPSK